MFEKEAEEWWNNKYLPSLYDNVSEVWQEGAEFGYNKANEWHFVKDGDLPKEFDKPYLCKVNSHFEVGYFMAYKEQPWHFDEYYLDNEDVIAWKEIVSPKESE